MPLVFHLPLTETPSEGFKFSGHPTYGIQKLTDVNC